MGFLDIFKKKKIDQPGPGEMMQENVIEIALKKAASDTASRTDFYKKLLSENLIVLTDKSERAEGFKMVQAGTTINVLKFPDDKVPVFTSKARIFDKGIIKQEVQTLEMKGEDLFQLTKGTTFILNPYSDYGKELIPDEVESLLNGTIFTANHRTITVEKETQVLIGQPSAYPTEIVEALTKLYKDRPTVKSAYLGWIIDPSSQDPPHLIFALDIDGEKQTIINESGFIAHQCMKPSDIVDFIQVGEGGISDYFTKQTKPFYERK